MKIKEKEGCKLPCLAFPPSLLPFLHAPPFLENCLLRRRSKLPPSSPFLKGKDGSKLQKGLYANFCMHAGKLPPPLKQKKDQKKTTHLKTLKTLKTHLKKIHKRLLYYRLPFLHAPPFLENCLLRTKKCQKGKAIFFKARDFGKFSFY